MGVGMLGGTNLGTATQTSVNFATLQSYIFVTFHQITFKLGIVAQDFEVFLAGRRIFANWSMPKVKTPRRVYLMPQKEANPTGTPPDQSFDCQKRVD